MSDLEITMLIQKFANEDDLYSKEVKNLLSEGGVSRLVCQYKTISRRLDKTSYENRELGHTVSVLEGAIDTLRSRCTENARELFDRNCYGGLTIVCHSKEMEFENKHLKQRIAELESKETETSSEIDTSTPINCANSLISHLTHLEAFLIAPERYERTFDIDDLEQIAEHLLVYCNHNKENE